MKYRTQAYRIKREVAADMLMPTERSDMAKFSKKGWSSDPNYDNFSSGGLERHVDKSRPVEELLARKDDFKNGENYHFTSCCPTPRVTAEPAGSRRTATND